MSRDLARRLTTLEAAMPVDLPLRTRKWFGETLTPEEEAQLAAEPEPEPMTAEEWDQMSVDQRRWFEERDALRPQS
jgi:hypothetical protein